MELSREVHRVGYHFPTIVVDQACHSLGVTLNASGRVTKSHFASLRDDELEDDQAKRRGKGKKAKGRFRKGSPKIDVSLSQAVIDTQAREAIEDLFPRIPRLDLHEIVSRAFDKVSKMNISLPNILTRRRQGILLGLPPAPPLSDGRI